VAFIDGAKASHRVRFITLLAERRSAPCCRPDTSLLSTEDQGAERRFAGKVVGANTIGEIKNTPKVFKISFGVFGNTHGGFVR
jgi:hypothetical protein